MVATLPVIFYIPTTGALGMFYLFYTDRGMYKKKVSCFN